MSLVNIIQESDLLAEVCEFVQNEILIDELVFEFALRTVRNLLATNGEI